MGSIIIYARSLETIRPVYSSTLAIYAQDFNVYVYTAGGLLYVYIRFVVSCILCVCALNIIFFVVFFFPSSVLFYRLLIAIGRSGKANDQTSHKSHNYLILLFYYYNTS